MGSKIRYSIIWAISGLLILMLWSCTSNPEDVDHFPLLYDHENMVEVRELIRSGDTRYQTAYNYLIQIADSVMNEGPYSVVSQGGIPPSGNNHDYSSMSPYWWADSTKPDGLPYIRKDGQVNPERNQYDKIPFALLGECVESLSLAYFFSGDVKYAEKAGGLIHHWFIQSETRMNPNLTFGQFIPGRSRIRGVGIIESRVLIKIAEAAILILPSGGWSDRDHSSLKRWYSEFLSWMMTSENGLDEKKRGNNHGSWYDVQKTYYALFTENYEVAEESIESLIKNRIENQIKSDGSQPHELARTRSFNYSVFNLLALSTGAELAKKLNKDIWHHEKDGIQYIKNALDFVIYNSIEKGPWPFKQISRIQYSDELFRLFALAHQQFGGDSYRNAIGHLPSDKISSSKELLRTWRSAEDLPNKKYELQLPALFGHHMVLQSDTVISITGKGLPYKPVTIQFAGQSGIAKPGLFGFWNYDFIDVQPGGPYSIEIKQDTIITFDDILVGEVWVCAGQSNMDMPVGGWGRINNYASILENSGNDQIRLFKVPRNMENKPINQIDKGSWVSASPEEVEDFSAIGYLFGKELQASIDMPVGIVHTAWGGTTIEAWMSEGSFEGLDEYIQDIQTVKMSTDSLDNELLDEYKKDLKSYIKTIESASTEFIYNSRENNECDLPDYWENWPEMDSFDGIVSFSKIIEIPDHWKSKDLILNLTVTDDYDKAYFNNHLLGSNNRKNYLSSYVVPGSIVTSNICTLRVDVIDVSGRGGIWGNEKDLNISLNSDQIINLSGKWAYQKIVSSDITGPAPPRPYLHKRPTVLYNGMIEPLTKHKIAGVVWYQGESNASEADKYGLLFSRMILDWRKKWSFEFPFYFVQLPNFDPITSNSVSKGWPELREAQRNTLKIPKTGMVVTIDLGDKRNIHPLDKGSVANRMANLVLYEVYGYLKDCYSPEIEAITQNGAQITLKFKNTYGGLSLKGDNSTCFEVAGKDGVFHSTEFSISDNNISLISNLVDSPEFVRYNWCADPKGHIYNKANLPATPFKLELNSENRD